MGEKKITQGSVLENTGCDLTFVQPIQFGRRPCIANRKWGTLPSCATHSCQQWQCLLCLAVRGGASHLAGGLSEARREKQRTGLKRNVPHTAVGGGDACAHPPPPGIPSSPWSPEAGTATSPRACRHHSGRLPRVRPAQARGSEN